MIVSHIDQVERKAMQGPGVEKAWKQICISPAEGWDSHIMRVFELEPGGKAPAHAHPWPHINYILKGEGIIHLNDVDHEVKEGSFAYIPANEHHQIRNRGNTIFQFICIVPEEGER